MNGYSIERLTNGCFLLLRSPTNVMQHGAGGCGGGGARNEAFYFMSEQELGAWLAIDLGAPVASYTVAAGGGGR